ncbi:hypothetical protein [Paracoccus sediminicola]|uniref:hypothetical protein n=1 Tax=Paracoccus sediminicola TaxID=3017783 RepID=UPI0022EFED5C|nr:hypothetical protein [Paracoccus sediminicola]WBU57580.1 hypothetical protein PAF18_03840 [Paracoccus sediminicola]
MADRQNIAAWAIAALALFLVVAGLLLTGGPAQSRAEYRDRIRIEDMMDLARNVVCQAETGEVMPDAPGATINCPGPLRLTDPFTGDSYRYETTGPRNFRICAGFEYPENIPSRLGYGADSFDPAAGCVISAVSIP